MLDSEYITYVFFVRIFLTSKYPNLNVYMSFFVDLQQNYNNEEIDDFGSRDG